MDIPYSPDHNEIILDPQGYYGSSYYPYGLVTEAELLLAGGSYYIDDDHMAYDRLVDSPWPDGLGHSELITMVFIALPR